MILTLKYILLKRCISVLTSGKRQHILGKNYLNNDIENLESNIHLKKNYGNV